MNILALETSSEACSCALLSSSGDSCERFELAPRRHTRLILGMVESLLAQGQMSLRELDCIAISHGPGSFTGVRIGMAVAQGLALGADVPVTPISSLRALAQGGLRRHQAKRVLAAFDARLGEVYAGAYCSDEQGLMQVCLDDCLINPEQLKFQQSGVWAGMGSAWPVYDRQLRQGLDLNIDNCYGDELPSAVDVAHIGQAEFKRGLALAPAEALPNYLRENVAQPKAGRTRTGG